jgi:methylenetetrahydrofolate dehydrogenase (NADP+)/methenyltetrahydrofolate cyclohydrolase/formyltetrahydrofolate synthetase
MGNAFGTPLHRHLDVITPVPSDIDIAQAVIPHDITRLCHELGLNASEYETYGAHKAKVRCRRSSMMPCRRGQGFLHVSGLVLATQGTLPLLELV